jgi:hypothetical protein
VETGDPLLIACWTEGWDLNERLEQVEEADDMDSAEKEE